MPTRPKSAGNNSHFEITNTTKGKLPRLPFAKMKNAVLGARYDLSLVIVGDKESQKLNRIYRGKNKPTNVLSFSLSKNEGEIFLNLTKARAETKEFAMPFENLVGYLFIHGLLHLKGLDHGSAMEKAEAKLFKRFEF